MPDIFKALATITAWMLFICGWLMGLSTFAMGLISGDLYGGGVPTLIYPVFFAVAAAEAVLAVVVMILRKKME